MPSDPQTDLAVIRRVVVDHIRTGLAHPALAVRRQAIALATEMDAAGFNVDHDVKALTVGHGLIPADIATRTQP